MTMKTRTPKRNQRIPPPLASLPPLEGRTLGCTTLEAAGYLGVGVNAIYKLLRTRELETYRDDISGKRRITPRSVARCCIPKRERPPMPRRWRKMTFEPMRDVEKANAARSKQAAKARAAPRDPLGV
jgi:excisionase family DNA binding protein